jgi:hypothetical protein
MYYTINGSTPTTSSSLVILANLAYHGTGTKTVRAIAVAMSIVRSRRLLSQSTSTDRRVIFDRS